MGQNKLKSETEERELKATKGQQSQECQYNSRMRLWLQYGRTMKPTSEENIDSRHDIKTNEKVLENKKKVKKIGYRFSNRIQIHQNNSRWNMSIMKIFTNFVLEIQSSKTKLVKGFIMNIFHFELF